ncbi:DUF397 domain-containing protein [Actinoallomurus rhizosphaericola]
MDSPILGWRKSARSGQEGGTCVEVAVFDDSDRRGA